MFKSTLANISRNPLSSPGLVIATITFALAAAVSAAVLVETEGNNLRATADDISDALFTLNVDSNVFGNFPTATLRGSIASPTDVDFFSFNGIAGSRFFADVDNSPFTFNSVLSLFDSTGTIIAFDFDSFPADPGSAFGFDSFLGRFTLPATQKYYLAISANGYLPSALLFQTYSTSDLFRPDGANGGNMVIGATPNALFINSGATGTGNYTLNVSLELVPEPATALFGAVLLSVAGLSRPRRVD